MIGIWTKLLISSIYVLMLSSTDKHPIYSSMTEVDYKAKSKTLEISVKIFADDLEKVLSEEKGERVEIGTDREHPKADAYIAAYLQAHLQFKVDGKKLQYKILGKEAGGKADMFAMFVFLEIKNVNSFKKLQVENSILIKQYDKQLNFVACHTSKGIKKVIARKGETNQEVEW